MEGQINEFVPGVNRKKARRASRAAAPVRKVLSHNAQRREIYFEKNFRLPAGGNAALSVESCSEFKFLIDKALQRNENRSRNSAFPGAGVRATERPPRGQTRNSSD
jgi:hypothetical protein